MAKKLSDGVGKKIVEALKKQSEIEVTPAVAEEQHEEFETVTDELSTAFDNESSMTQEPFPDSDFLDNLPSDDYLETLAEKEAEPSIDITETPIRATSQPYNYQQPVASISDSVLKELDNFEIPSNIAILKKLISQLPSGVTRHTGAQIIKQTMEALGISMKSVLQEAQQAQEGLNASVKECFSNIQEYKKNIVLLEKQAQSHQKQYAALNELISLFIQTGV